MPDQGAQSSNPHGPPQFEIHIDGKRVSIESEADGGDHDDHPLHSGEARRVRFGLRLGHGLERNKFTAVRA